MAGADNTRDAGGGVRLARSHRWRAAAWLLAGLHLLTSCYAWVPVSPSVAPGAPLSLELTDEGRLAHTAALGPGVLRAGGVLTRMDGDRYVLDVGTVKPIRGPELPVSGISVSFGPRDVTDVRIRTLSRKRTGIVIGTAVAIVAAFLIGKGFSSGSTPADDKGPPGGPDQ